MNGRACKTCVYFVATTTDCRRFPPQMVLWASDNQHPIRYDTISCWPTMSPDLWCGEHKLDEKKWADELAKGTIS
jgi:hypothetical protein